MNEKKISLLRATRWPRKPGQNMQIGCLGKKGSGKTTIAAEYIALADRPVVVVDTTGEFAGDYMHPDRKIGKLFTGVAVSTSQLSGSLAEAFDYMNEGVDAYPGRFVFCVQVRSKTADLYNRERLEEFHRLMAFCFKVQKIIVVIDEVDQYCSPSMLPAGLRDIVNLGRHNQIDSLFCSRRAARVHRDLTANADRIHVFQTTEPRDLQYLADCMPVTQAADLAKLPTLPVGKCVTFNMRASK